MLTSFIDLMIFSFVDTKSQNEQKTSLNLDKIKKAQKIISLIELSILIVIILFIYITFTSVIMMILSTIGIIYTIYKLITRFTFRKVDIYLYLCASIFYFNFFRSNSMEILFNNIDGLGITWYKYFILLFSFIKIFVFLILLLLNIGIFIKYLNSFISKSKRKKILSAETYEIEFNKYEFSSYKKKESTISFIFDCIIFAISFPLYIIVFIKNIMWCFFRKLKNKTKEKILLFISYLDKNMNKVVRKILKFSTVITILIIYIALLYDDSFDNKIKDVFNILAISILCPIIIDSLNTKNKSL